MVTRLNKWKNTFKEAMSSPWWTVLLVFFKVHICTLGHDGNRFCGRPLGNSLHYQEKIVGGYDVGYYKYPWYVALVRKGIVGCGGTLIGPQTVLSAAHCFKEFIPLANKGSLKLEDVYTIKLGVYNICITEDSQTVFKVKQVIIHELYVNKSPYYDISLIKLEGDTSKYQPLCLPLEAPKQKPPEGNTPGLGVLKYQGATPCTMHEARLLIYDDQECKAMLKQAENDPSKFINAFCAGYIQGGVDTCQGDSGGPLQILSESGEFILYGIVSFGFHCANPGLLGVYTDVSKYISWIKEKSGLNFSNIQLGSYPNVSDNRPPVDKPNHLVPEVPVKIIIINKSQKGHSTDKNSIKKETKIKN